MRCTVLDMCINLFYEKQGLVNENNKNSCDTYSCIFPVFRIDNKRKL